MNLIHRLSLSAGLLISTCVLSVHAGLQYWDPQGTSGANPYTGSLSGTWETSNWSGTSAGASPGSAWTEGNTPDFSVHTGVGTPAYTITAGANHTIGGVFCGFNAGSSTNSISGSGILTLNTGEDGFNLTSGSYLTVNNTIAGSGGIVTAEGNGQLFLYGANTYGGGTELGYIDATPSFSSTFTGILNFNNKSSFGTGAIHVKYTGESIAALVGNNSTNITFSNPVTWDNMLYTNFYRSTNMGINIVPGAASGVVTFSGAWTLNANITNANVFVNDSASKKVIISGVISGGATGCKFNKGNVGILELSGANTFANQITISNGVLQVGSSIAIPSGSGKGDVSITSPGVFDLNGFNPNINGLTQSGTGGTVTNSSATAATLTIGNNNATSTFSGSITNGNTINIVKTGTGTTTLSAANGFAGNLTINSGVLQTGAAGAFGAGTLIMNAGTICASSTTGRTITNPVTLAANMTLGDSVNTGGLTFSTGAWTISGASRTLTTPSAVTISSAIGDGGSGFGLTKAGTSTLSLNGANTYGGDTIVNAGTIQVNGTGTFGNGSGTVNLAGGNFNLTASRGSTAVIANPFLLSSSATVSGSAANALLRSSGTWSGNDGVTLTLKNGNNGTFDLIWYSGGFNFTNPVVIAANGDTSSSQLTAFNDNTTSDLTISGLISGNGSFRRSVSSGTGGNVILTGQNTYNGSLNGGICLSNNNGYIGVGADSVGTPDNVTAGPLGIGTNAVGGGGLFASGAARNVLNTLWLTGTMNVGGANDLTLSGTLKVVGGNRTINVTNTGLTTISGAITDDGTPRTLTKAGSGTLVYSGTSAATGAAAITGGTLKVTGSLASMSGLTVGPGTVTGSGPLPATIITNAGAISPGSGPGTITINGDMTLYGGGTNVVEMNASLGTAGSDPGWDYTHVTGALNINSTSANRFVIKLNSLDLSDNANPCSDFNTSGFGNTWTILTADGGINGFDASEFIVDYSGFSPVGVNGGFGVVTNGNSLQLVYNAAPNVTSNPSSVTANKGDSPTFTITAGGTPPLSYQWLKGGVSVSNGTQPSGAVVSGATTPTLTISGVSYLDEGGYSCLVTGTGSATSTTATLTVIDPPVITSPAVSSTIAKNAGDSLTLTATVSGRPATAYQWKKGGVNLANGSAANRSTVAGSTTPSLTLTGVYAQDSGDYTIAVTNADGSATSVATTLAVADPIITSQPANATFECGSANCLSVTAGGSTNLTYQWYTPNVNGTGIFGATNSTLCFTNVHALSAGSYVVVVSNVFGSSITSQVATVTVRDTTAPVVTLNGNASVTVECHGSFSDPGASVVDACDGNSTISSATSGLANLNVVGDYTQSYTTSDSAGNPGNVVTRVVHVGDTTGPALVGVPPDTTAECSSVPAPALVTANDACDPGASVTETESTISGTCAQSYTLIRTWTAKDATGNTSQASQSITVQDTTAPAITLTNGATMTVECHSAFTDPGASAQDDCAGSIIPVVSGGPVDTNTPGQYTLTYTATDPCGNSKTATRVVTVNDSTPPVVTLNGDAEMTAECHGTFDDPGASVTDSCDANATNVVQSGTVDLNAVGFYTRTYTVTDAGNNNGTTARVIHVIDTQLPVITVTPPPGGTNSICQNDVYTDPGATVVDACDSTLTSVIPSGSVDPTTIGSYTLTYTATDAGGNKAVATRVVQVLFCHDPNFTSQPTDVVAATGHSAIFNVTAIGTGPFRYMWSRNGVPLKKDIKNKYMGVQTASLTVLNCNDKIEGGSYTCTVTNVNNDMLGSTPGFLKVYDSPLVHVAPKAKNNVVAGNNVVFASHLGKGFGQPVLTYQWYFGATPLVDNAHVVGSTAATLSLIDVALTDSGNYTCVVSNSSLTTGQDTATLGVIEDPAPVAVLLMVPLKASPAKPALIDGQTPPKFVQIHSTNAVAPQIDFFGAVVDKGLITQVGVSNAMAPAGSNIFAGTVVDKVNIDPAATLPKTKNYFLVHASLIDGTNIFYGIATNVSTNVTISKVGLPIYYMGNPSICTFVNSGSGKIFGVTDKIWGIESAAPIVAPLTLEIGHVYTVKATATGPHHTFVQWILSDPNVPTTVTPKSPTTSLLTFTMTNNLTITAKYSDAP